MTDRAIVTTAPVFKVEGEARGEMARDLQWLEVEETVDGLKSLRARLLGFGRPPGGGEDRALYLDGVVDFGKRVEVTLGPQDAERKVFDGKVTAIEVAYEEDLPAEVTLFAEDALMDLRMTRRSRTYRSVSDADIARQIAGDHGIEVDASAEGPTYDVVQQFDQSDLAFLRDRARLIQAEVQLVDGALKFLQRPQRAATPITLRRGEELVEVRIRADLAHQRTKVSVSGYDASNHESIHEEADDDAVRAEVTEGRTGPSVLQQALGARESQRVRDVPLTGEEARQWARAEMLRRARSFVVACGATRGTADMVVGSALTLEDVGAPFSGDGYYVVRVVHSYDLARGLRTRFEAERATLREAT